MTRRYGIKESTGGIGADADFNWWDRDLKLSLDGFDATFDKYPRIKLSAAYELFRHIYVLGGIDELLNAPKTLDIVTGTSEVPIQFETFRYGRDVFFGAMLKFNDEDLAALLTDGGSALSGATKSESEKCAGPVRNDPPSSSPPPVFACCCRSIGKRASSFERDSSVKSTMSSPSAPAG